MDNDGTIYSDTPGSVAPSSDLDYFQKKLYPGQVPPVAPVTGSGWKEVPSQQEEFEAAIKNQIEESRKHAPERAQQILRQLLDAELNRAITTRPARKPAVAM